MPNYGFAIDLRKCIGCHACTIACKVEHQIPVGVNRCWVKTVEKGSFPDTRRFFFPVLCNQCEDAPCVRICPTNTLYRRRDGIVDFNQASCIGCRACMEACPYDQLFIDPNTHTAEKCNFCANRVENKLQPACVIVCPTQCRIFGDLDDPTTEVSQIFQREAFMVRKPEKGTGPKVLYLGAEESVIRPEASVRPLYYKEGQVHLRPEGAPMPDPESPGDARVDYDIPHGKPWGLDMVLYLLFKAIGTGVMLIAALVWLLGFTGPLVTVAAPIVSILFITLTAIVLIVDLERPERFYYILTRSNWRSWMVWGAYFLTAHGALSTLWLAAGWVGLDHVYTVLAVPMLVVAILATSYTGFLFAQGLGRDLWQGPIASVDLLLQSGIAGAAALLLVAEIAGIRGFVTGSDHVMNHRAVLGFFLGASLAGHLLVLLFEHLLTPSPTKHHELATQTFLRGVHAPLFWGGAIIAGGLIPLVLLMTIGIAWSPIAAVFVSVLAIAGGAAWEYIWVEAGQSVPLS
jgi:Fe-S-cluster-containing dehydrogenase component/formate-dependent nitrite reductase membrane component NrfD